MFNNGHFLRIQKFKINLFELIATFKFNCQMQAMKRVTGIGGIFFKCENPERVKNWYQKHLGLNVDQYGTSFEFKSSESQEKSFLQWSPFAEDTKYFLPSQKDFMINYRVENLEKLVEVLRDEGVKILDDIEVYEYGKFVHILDIENNKIELWEPNDSVYDKMIEVRTP